MSSKKIVILHSNDLHGDFLPRQSADGHCVGGVSLLSDYINRVRKEEKNVLYTISGDMFRGSIIDSEYRGISTIEILNVLAPDVVTLGNHEVDYGIAHLLFIEKCAAFPIINANMYLTINSTRLFHSHIVLETDGMKILFIGVLTEDVLAQTKRERLVGSLIDVTDEAAEIGSICLAHQKEDIDLTVVLTHIGIDADRSLAAALDPAWGVDLIIGGHSHTVMSSPVCINGIPILHAAHGTAQIGRLEAEIDTSTNRMSSFTWSLIPIASPHCQPNPQMETVVERYRVQTDAKYNRVIADLGQQYTHPVRNAETSLGKLLADAFCEVLDLDIMLLGSGSIRTSELGPTVIYRDILETFPFNDEIFRIYVSGQQLRTMIRYMLREEAFVSRTEFYQLSRGLFVEYDRSRQSIESFTYKGKSICDDDCFRVGIQGYHMSNLKAFLNVTEEEVSSVYPPKIIATRCTDILEMYFSSYETAHTPEETRLLIH